VIKQGPNRLPVRLTAAVVRGNTELQVWIDDDTPCVCIEINGIPYPVLLGITPSGAENLHTAITTGLADLTSRVQRKTGDLNSVGTDGEQ
jgi:hypothetical protein